MYPVTYRNSFRLDNLVRPSNTTAYSVGQAINSSTPRLLFFPVTIGRNGGYITRATLVTNNSAHTASIRLHLFDNPITATADQSPLSLTYANGQSCEGYIDFTTFVVPGSSSYAFSEGVIVSRPLQIQNSVDNNVYGLLEVRTAFTPTSAQEFGVSIFSEFSA